MLLSFVLTVDLIGLALVGMLTPDVISMISSNPAVASNKSSSIEILLSSVPPMSSIKSLIPESLFQFSPHGYDPPPPVLPPSFPSPLSPVPVFPGSVSGSGIGSGSISIGVVITSVGYVGYSYSGYVGYS